MRERLVKGKCQSYSPETYQHRCINWDNDLMNNAKYQNQTMPKSSILPSFIFISMFFHLLRCPNTNFKPVSRENPHSHSVTVFDFQFLGTMVVLDDLGPFNPAGCPFESESATFLFQF